MLVILSIILSARVLVYACVYVCTCVCVCVCVCEMTLFYPLLHTPRTTHNVISVYWYHLQCIVDQECYPSRTPRIEIGSS